METIAKQGADAFYNGKIGQDLIQDIKNAGWCKCCMGKLDYWSLEKKNHHSFIYFAFFSVVDKNKQFSLLILFYKT